MKCTMSSCIVVMLWESTNEMHSTATALTTNKQNVYQRQIAWARDPHFVLFVLLFMYIIIYLK